MRKKRYAKALLQDKNCDNCDHYAIEFNGIESCVLKVTDITRNQALEVPSDRACDNWEQENKDPFRAFKTFIKMASNSKGR